MDPLKDFNQLLSVENYMKDLDEEKKAKDRDVALDSENKKASGAQMMMEMDRERRELIGIKLKKR